MKRFLFYDLETTGLNKSFDQILQFAAISTDEKLKEIERYAISVKLRPDVIPSPRATLTHRISPSAAMEGLTELEAVRHIHALLNTPGTISLGYNTLGFDDEFLRFSFYRNLLPPYTHQYANQCGRMDLLPITVLYFLYKPDVISWPEVDGKPTMKLEHLSKANALAEGPAHDAMVDVEATVALARRLYREKGMWDYVTGYFSKPTDQGRINTLPSAFDSAAGMHLYGIMTGSKFGPDQLYQAPVLYIGDSIPYSNQSLWLKLDDGDLKTPRDGDAMDNVRVIRKRMGEPNIILPPLDRFLKRLSPERKEMVRENLSWIQHEKKRFYDIVSWFCEFRYPDVEHVDVDASLYLSGFLSREEQMLCKQFHQQVQTNGAGFIREFDKAPLRTQALRILFRNFSCERFKGFEKDYERFMEAVNPMDETQAMNDFRDEKRLTPRMALSEIGDIRQKETLDDDQLRVLGDLEDYLKRTFNLA